jgi:ubiquinone/menaquinone biosynthesis C-methylase UbiE
MPSAQEERVRREYDRLATHYDRRWSFYIQATTRETQRRIPLQEGQSLLDVGCGTGALLQEVQSRYPRNPLAGIDLSEPMLHKARQKLGEAVELKHASADRLPFKDRSFDFVVSSSAFHFFPHPHTALSEMWRVLRVHGWLVITDWCRDYLTCQLCDWGLRVIDPAHHQTYRAVELRALLEVSGYRQIAIERYKINWFWGLMTATGKKDTALEGSASNR